MAYSRGMQMLEMALNNRGNEWGAYKSRDGNNRDFSEEKLPTFDSDCRDYDTDYEEVPVETENVVNELLENVNDILIQFPVDFKTVPVEENSVILTGNENDHPDVPSTLVQEENVIVSDDESDYTVLSTPVQLEDGDSNAVNKSSKRRKLSLKSTHPLRAPCSCKNKCILKICDVRRKQIHEQFWRLPKNEQNHHLYKSILTKSISRRRPRKPDCGKIRTASRSYILKDECGSDQTVCKTMFLATFGYKSDRVISNLFLCNTPTKIKPNKDRRGKHSPKHKMTDDVKDLISSHISKFNPCISHYRRKHAPNRLYLPSELNIKIMYDYFKEEHDVKVCYKSYSNFVRKMNISFTKLGEEICEVCREFELHEHQMNNADFLDKTNLDWDESLVENIDDWASNILKGRNIDLSESCTLCQAWKEHALQAKITRLHYQIDKEKNHNSNEAYYAADMEKVIMLPRLPGMKKAIFTRRIVLFNETFAPLGGKQSLRDTIAVLWHEGIKGRNDEDLASTVTKVLKHEQNKELSEFTFWVDNCSAQNKNWTLMSAMISEINAAESNVEFIKFKYFEKGHTFMAADSFHHQVEEAIKQRKYLYNFDDFVSAVKSKGKVDVMLPVDFFNYTKELSYGKKGGIKYPLLADIREAMFKKGSTKLYWKTDMREPEYECGEFAKKQYRQSIISGRPHVKRNLQYRGVQKKKSKV